MKRSEMIEELSASIHAYLEEEVLSDQVVSEILTDLENAGMIPPNCLGDMTQKPNKFQQKVIDEAGHGEELFFHKWEPENE